MYPSNLFPGVISSLRHIWLTGPWQSEGKGDLSEGTNCKECQEKSKETIVVGTFYQFHLFLQSTPFVKAAK